jgi:hypothetical protein
MYDGLGNTVIFIVPQKFPHHPLTFEGTNPFTSVFIEYLIYSAALAVMSACSSPGSREQTRHGLS